ncbi:MAG TPA: hypothetical protein VL727_02250 [Puia sp.]|jgi:hypothetical protein|nr:hypothetical protein [Puia sp.]
MKDIILSELESLQKRLNELEPFLNKPFDTIHEFNQDKALHEIAKEYGAIKRRMFELSWSLKDAAEKKEIRLAKIQLAEKYYDENQNEARAAFMKDYLALIELLTKMDMYKVLDEDGSSFFRNVLSQLQQHIFIGLKV